MEPRAEELIPTWPVPSDTLDPVRLVAWMDDQRLGNGPLTHATLVTGGTQNILLRFWRGDRQYVLRRPPEHKRASSDETIRREARVLAALAGTDVPHPALVAACGDLSVIGAAFYLMDPVDGFNPTEELPGAFASDLALQRRMGLAMADTIATLGRVDPRAVGIADLGRAEGWLERQVDRWRSQLESYERLPGYRPGRLSGVDEVAGWLDAHRPRAWAPGLIHGDFHFANVLFDRERPTVLAIVDWELATIGDPLIDLAHLLATWPDASAPADAAVILDAPGLPSAEEVVDRYASWSERDLGAFTWYRVLACYRLAILLEGTHARASAGLALREVGDRLHATAVALFRRALALVGAN